MIIDGNDEQEHSDEPGVVEHSRQGSDDLGSEAQLVLGAIDQAKDGYRDNVKDSPAVARSTFAEEIGMGINALRGKLEDRDEDELAGELRWDLEADDFDAEIQRVRSAVQRVAEGAAEQHEDDSDSGSAEDDAGEGDGRGSDEGAESEHSAGDASDDDERNSGDEERDEADEERDKERDEADDDSDDDGHEGDDERDGSDGNEHERDGADGEADHDERDQSDDERDERDESGDDGHEKRNESEDKSDDDDNADEERAAEA
jgi:hypothetical protein